MTQILVKAYPLLAAQGNLPGRFEAVTYRLAGGEDAVERPWEPGPCALPRPTLAGAGGEGVASAVQAHRGAGGTCGADTPGPPLPHP